MEKLQEVFRHGVIIFVGETGRNVYRYLFQQSDSILPALQTYLQKWQMERIQFVRLEDNNTDYRHQFATSHEILHSGDLDSACSHMYDTFKHNMADSEPTEPLVYVVGHVYDDEVRRAVTTLRSQEADWHIRCLCCCYPHAQGQHEASAAPLTGNQNLIPDDLTHWCQEQNVDFCHLFGDTTTNTSVQSNDYAAALALFTLLTLGITLQDTYKNAIQSRSGTLSACLVVVPQEAILRACRFQVGALLIADWLAECEAIQQNKHAIEEIDTLAENDIRAVCRTIIEEQEPRPGANEQKKSAWWWSMFNKDMLSSVEHYTWPGLSILKGEQSLYLSAYQDLEQCTKDLFQPTIPNNQPPNRTELQAIEEHYQQAQEVGWHEWRQRAKTAWNGVHREMVRKLDMTLQGLVNEKKGVGWIISYVNTLDKKLETVLAQIKAGATEEFHPHNEQQEEPLYNALLQAIEQQPAPSLLLVLALLACTAMMLFLLLLANMLFPLSGEVGWPQWLIVVLVPFMSIVAGHWFFLRQFYLPGMLAKHKLLRHHRSIHASYCGSEERTQQMYTIQTLRSHIENMKKETLIIHKDLLEEKARQIFSRLFDNVAATRCIFVGDSRYFPQNDEFTAYTFLKPMLGRVGQQKTTAEKMFAAIRPSIMPQYASYLSGKFPEESIQAAQMSKDTPVHPVEDFDIRINGLLKSQINAPMQLPENPDAGSNIFSVKVRMQLNDMWRDIFGRLNSKLWRKQKESKDAQSLILCGTNTALTASFQRAKGEYKGKFTEVLTFSSEMSEQGSKAPTEKMMPDWFLVATLYYDQDSDEA